MRQNTETIRSEVTVQSSTHGGSASLGYDSTAHNLSVRVVEAVAEAAGVDETAVTTTLATAVDPDALDTLFVDGASGAVSFEFVGYHVSIRVFEDGTGRVTVES